MWHAVNSAPFSRLMKSDTLGISVILATIKPLLMMPGQDIALQMTLPLQSTRGCARKATAGSAGVFAITRRYG